jgi:hypothetical protein
MVKQGNTPTKNYTGLEDGQSRQKNLFIYKMSEGILLLIISYLWQPASGMRTTFVFFSTAKHYFYYIQLRDFKYGYYTRIPSHTTQTPRILLIVLFTPWHRT